MDFEYTTDYSSDDYVLVDAAHVTSGLLTPCLLLHALFVIVGPYHFQVFIFHLKL